jgi:hypothetical protein
MKERVIVLAVLGYGCHLTEALKQYLLEVTYFLRWQDMGQNTRIIIITSGGFTNHSSAPNVSEAKMMADFLKEHTFCEILTDRKARTTRENIYGVSEVLKRNDLNPDKVFIFCDKLREIKVSFFAKRVLKTPFEVITHDFHKGWKSWVKQAVATPLTLVGFYLPILHKIEILLRKRKMVRN